MDYWKTKEGGSLAYSGRKIGDSVIYAVLLKSELIDDKSDRLPEEVSKQHVAGVTWVFVRFYCLY